MAEYIEREKALKALSEARELDDGWHSIDDIIDMVYSRIEDIPSASVRPERHGHWNPNYIMSEDYESDWFECSLCGGHSDDNDDAEQFCPHCGAKMDGKDGKNNA